MERACMAMHTTDLSDCKTCTDYGIMLMQSLQSKGSTLFMVCFRVMPTIARFRLYDTAQTIENGNIIITQH